MVSVQDGRHLGLSIKHPVEDSQPAFGDNRKTAGPYETSFSGCGSSVIIGGRGTRHSEEISCLLAVQWLHDYLKLIPDVTSSTGGNQSLG